MSGAKSLYRYRDVALLRAAAAALTDGPEWWPDPGDTAECRAWLDEVWSQPPRAEAIRLASRTLADRVASIRGGCVVTDKQVRRATLATARYLLRSVGRPTPFGVFAGVAPASLGRSAEVCWGDRHQCLARVNTVWLADVIERLEECPELLERLHVQVTNLAVRRGGRLEVPQGPNRVSIRRTRAVEAVRDAAAVPIRFGALAEHLDSTFPTADRTTVRAMLTDLVRQNYLITCLHAVFTVTDPLGHVLSKLRAVGADELTDASPDLATRVRNLEDIDAGLREHNDAAPAEQPALRETINARMAEVSGQGRAQLTGDLILDCAVGLPRQVAREMERAASALLRLTRHPSGEPTWRAYHAAFVDRYGAGALVPLADVLDPDTGLGYPAGYPGSVLPEPSSGATERDQRLLSLAWEAIANDDAEITLTDEVIAALTGPGFDERCIPPHVELAARVHASSRDVVDRGEFTLSVAPARAAGTLTSRFTPLATGSGLDEAYRALPAATENALRVQLSFGPLYPNAENVCRVPAYLDHVLPLGEHRHIDGPSEAALLTVDDLAVIATRDRLHLVSMSRCCVVEPEVFHALDLRKQPPALARFLASLPRAFSAGWYQFDWGPHANLPRLPRVRYRRTVLFPAQWRLTTDDLPDSHSGREWRQALNRWRDRWHCPSVVELRDADRTLRLSMDESTHLALLRAHLARHGQAILIEAAPPSEFGWLDGHVHEVALPLVSSGQPAPNPLHGHLPVVRNVQGQMPGASGSRWLSVKLFTHPERMNEIVTDHLSTLLADLGTDEPASACWWLRYRSPHETDHLRLRIRTDDEQYSKYSTIVGEWSQRMRDAGLLGRMVLDTYLPEVGRYGRGPALEAAEHVFGADSATAVATLRHQSSSDTDVALVVANMVGIVAGFFGDLSEAMTWLVNQPVAAAPTIERAVSDRAIRLATDSAALAQIPGWETDIGPAWARRADSLGRYRTALPQQANVAVVLESLLHMLHNRLAGIDPDSERTCRRLARQAALAWQARPDGGAQ